MPDVTLETPQGDSRFDDYVQRYGAHVLDNMGRVFLKNLRDNLKAKLRSTVFTPKALERYPFLAQSDFPTVLMECVYLSPGHDELSVVVNQERLKVRGFPANVLDILEYGNADVPALFAVRKTIQETIGQSA